MSSLYRKEALEAQTPALHGKIILIQPMSFRFLTAMALAMAGVVILFLLCGTYTRHSTVGGQLVPDGGLIRIYAPQTGVVLERHVQENQHVDAGDVLFIISSERRSSIENDTQASISAQIAARGDSLRNELNVNRLLQQKERDLLVSKVGELRSQLELLNRQIEGQQRRVDLSQGAVNTYQTLLAKKYISREQLQQKQFDLLDQEARLESLQRDRIGLAHEFGAQQAELGSLAPRQSKQNAQIDRALSGTAQELSESEAKRRLVITASEAGTVTNLVADVGQAVDGQRPLLGIMPANAALHAELYAPSRAIGFVRAGDRVLLRYQAYPYQKFGHYAGTVSWVSKTALPQGNPAGPATTAANTEPQYEIRVQLGEQSVLAYGKPQPLQPGMLLEADVLQERRHLYEWVLDPLFSLSGRV
jgi:membrane fusion protein